MAFWFTEAPWSRLGPLGAVLCVRSSSRLAADIYVFLKQDDHSTRKLKYRKSCKCASWATCFVIKSESCWCLAGLDNAALVPRTQGNKANGP